MKSFPSEMEECESIEDCFEMATVDANGEEDDKNSIRVS